MCFCSVFAYLSGSPTSPSLPSSPPARPVTPPPPSSPPSYPSVLKDRGSVGPPHTPVGGAPRVPPPVPPRGGPRKQGHDSAGRGGKLCYIAFFSFFYLQFYVL